MPRLKDIVPGKVAVFKSEKQFFDLRVQIGPADHFARFENIAKALTAHEHTFS